MTAYGQSSITTSLGRFSFEIQSVNRKHLEIHLNIPKELLRFDHEVRKLISSVVSRGQVTFRLNARFEGTAPTIVTPNLPLARQMKAAWDILAKELNLAPPDSLELLASQPDILLFSDELANEDLYRKMIIEGVQAALQKFNEMRQKEGTALQKDIEKYFVQTRDRINQISHYAPNATAKYRQKLKDRIEEVLPGSVDNEERILKEICLFAERVDITEEITRFRSHLDQCADVLSADAMHSGKTLEFLLQEMGREINTIGSKSSEIEVARLVIEIKGDLERIREQIQNVE